MQIKSFTLFLALLALSAASLDVDARERDRRGEANYAQGQQHSDARSEARERSRGQRDSYAQSHQYGDAQPKHGRYDRRHDGRHQRWEQHGRHDRSRYRNDQQWMWAGYGFYNQPHYYGPSYHYATSRHHGYQRYRAPNRYSYPRGYHAQRWSVGGYLPSSYYASHYYIDYRHYGLARPPRGHHWVRIDNDVVLVAIASGLVTQVLFDLLYY
jgi:Ni/Co efflux regulator RcnB